MAEINSAINSISYPLIYYIHEIINQYISKTIFYILYGHQERDLIFVYYYLFFSPLLDLEKIDKSQFLDFIC